MTNKITKAAIRLSDKIYVGFDHGECFKQLPSGVNANEIEQGFIDINGDFLDRKQAMLIAKEAGQISYDTDKQTLISEDLHLYWLKELEEKYHNSIKWKIDDDLYEMIIEYLFNQGVKVDGQEYWCLLDVPSDKMNSNDFTNEIKNVFKTIFETYGG